ncbi:MAG: hypothetical protein ABIW85_04025 [Variovorax sp.]
MAGAADLTPVDAVVAQPHGSAIYRFLWRYWWLAFVLMGITFVLFGLVTLTLLHMLGANIELLAAHGIDAVRDGGLRQFVELVVSGYFGAACYVVFKLCEKLLVERLAAGSKP